MGIFIEHFASREDFEEWLALVGESVKVKNVSTGTRGGPAAHEGTTYTVTYEAATRVSKRA